MCTCVGGCGNRVFFWPGGHAGDGKGCVNVRHNNYIRKCLRQVAQAEDVRICDMYGIAASFQDTHMKQNNDVLTRLGTSLACP